MIGMSLEAQLDYKDGTIAVLKRQTAGLRELNGKLLAMVLERNARITELETQLAAALAVIEAAAEAGE